MKDPVSKTVLTLIINNEAVQRPFQKSLSKYIVMATLEMTELLPLIKQSKLYHFIIFHSHVSYYSHV